MPNFLLKLSAEKVHKLKFQRRNNLDSTGCLKNCNANILLLLVDEDTKKYCLLYERGVNIIYLSYPFRKLHLSGNKQAFVVSFDIWIKVRDFCAYRLLLESQFKSRKVKIHKHIKCGNKATTYCFRHFSS